MVDDWIPSVNTIEAEVKILVCDSCSLTEEENSKLIKKIHGKVLLRCKTMFVSNLLL